MRSVLERIVVRYPRVVGRCCEVAAIWVAGEAAMLGEGQTLRRNENDILPGLAQAVREYGIDPAEMARECGVDPFELRRKLALSRFGELLKPGEIRSLTDQALESKLQQAAREYNLEVDQLLDEISDPCAVAASVGAALKVRSGAVKIAWILRCWMCRRLRPQRYRIDFTPHLAGEHRPLSEPAYACQYCLPTHLTDQQVQQITRLSESKVPNSPSVMMRSAAFAAVVILVFSSWYIHASGARNTRMPKLSTTRAPAQLTTEIEPVSETPPVPAEHTEKDPPAVAALPKQVPLVSTAVAPSPVASGSQVSGIVTRKQTEIAAASVVTPPDVEPAQGTAASGRAGIATPPPGSVAAATEAARTMPRPSAHRTAPKRTAATEVPPPAETRAPREESLDTGSAAPEEARTLTSRKRTASIGNGTSSEHTAAISPRYRRPRYDVQIDAAMDRNGADSMAQRFQRLGYTPHLVPTVIAGQTWYKVEVGPYATQDEAAAAQEQLHQKYNSAYISH